MPCRYLDPAATITLREGLEEYRRSFPDLVSEDGLSGTARELFRAHDVAHVVFGCDTTIRQEAMIDTWTLLGTDLGLGAYLGYLKLPEAREVIREAGLGHTLWESLRALPDVVRVARRARRMKKLWPWRDHQAYLDRRLIDIRRELGIELCVAQARA